jgi:hypothetical protein
MWLFPNSLPHLFYPISSNSIFIKINPHGKEFAMNIQRAHGVGNAVAWGHHLRVPLHFQNCKLSTPSGEKPPTDHQKENYQHDNDVTSAFVGKHTKSPLKSQPASPTCVSQITTGGKPKVTWGRNKLRSFPVNSNFPVRRTQESTHGKISESGATYQPHNFPVPRKGQTKAEQEFGAGLRSITITKILSWNPMS